MTPAIQQKIKEYSDKFIINPGRVVELGSYDVNGGVRQFFGKSSSYLGIDMQEGPGVDMVANIHLLEHLFDYQPDTILCLETLEHDNQPWLSINSMKKVLKPGGMLVISTPANGFPEHKFPNDYFRYMPDAYTHFFFDGFDILDLTVVTWEGYSTICGIAQKPYNDSVNTK